MRTRSESPSLTTILSSGRTRPAREFLERMTKAPDDVLTEASLASFERLFGVVSDRYERGRKTKAA